MSKFGEPVHETLDPADVARWTRQRRAKDNVDRLPGGFTFRADGRQGFIYYRDDGGRILEIFWEMAGPDNADIILFLQGIRQWALPQVAAVSQADQSSIEASLRAWLDQSGVRAVIAE